MKVNEIYTPIKLCFNSSKNIYKLLNSLFFTKNVYRNAFSKTYYRYFLYIPFLKRYQQYISHITLKYTYKYKFDSR